MPDKLKSELGNKEFAISSVSDLGEVEYFEEVLAEIEGEYSNLIDQKTLVEYAIAGIFSKLDSYSYYLSSEEFKKMQLQALGFNAVSTKVVDDIAYIKISEFNESTCNHFRRQWLNIKEITAP